MGVTKVVVTGARQGVKYAPVIASVFREVRGPATDYARSRVEASRQRRLAVAKAESVRDGTVLRLMHGEQTVWVVYSGDQPISAHPDNGVPLTELTEHANLERRRRPEEFPSTRERASAARKKTVSKIKLPHRKSDVSVPDPDAELVGEGVGQLDELDPADGGPAQAGQALRRE